MRYGSWDTKWDRQNFLSFWAIFCTFNSLTTWKIKLFKKWKKHLEISTFYTCATKITIIWCMLPEIWSATDISYHFGPFFAHYWPRKLKFGKTVGNTWRYYPFTHVYHKWRSYDIWLLKYKVQQTVFCHFRPFSDLWLP